MNGSGQSKAVEERKDDHTGHRERLKERFLRHGALGLSAEDLLELVLMYAIPRRDVRPLAEELLLRFGSLERVVTASTVELARVDGISTHTATLLRLIGELPIKLAGSAPPLSDVLNNPKELERFLIARLSKSQEEQLLLLLLDDQGLVLGEQTMGAGTVNRLVTFPRQVMQTALKLNASRLIIAHNHPHGPPLPSVRDREEAERLRDILHPFDLTVEDCIVVTGSRCFSIFKNRPL
jgi:DNA repair protein RadC